MFDIQLKYFRLIMIPEPTLGKIVFYEYIQFKNAFQFSKHADLVRYNGSRLTLKTKPVIIIFLLFSPSYYLLITAR